MERFALPSVVESPVEPMQIDHVVFGKIIGLARQQRRLQGSAGGMRPARAVGILAFDATVSLLLRVRRSYERPKALVNALGVRVGMRRWERSTGPDASPRDTPTRLFWWSVSPWIVPGTPEMRDSGELNRPRPEPLALCGQRAHPRHHQPTPYLHGRSPHGSLLLYGIRIGHRPDLCNPVGTRNQRLYSWRPHYRAIIAPFWSARA